MRIISCKLRDFASYKELNFDFEDQGLTLIQGPTGSGKSTLCDAAPWILFGRTAKDGSVDEIRSWGATYSTDGTLIFELKGQKYYVRRIRGKSNDLFFGPYTTWIAEGTRGKDLNDTQRLINNLLGIDVNLYLSGAYFHEFSQTAQFFTTTAKNRRAICEQLVDLSLAKKLQESLKNEGKLVTQNISDNGRSIQRYTDVIQRLERKNDYEEKAKTFEEDKKARLLNINTQIKKLSAKVKPAKYFFDERKSLLKAKESLGSDKCPECGAKKHSNDHTEIDKLLNGLLMEANANDTYVNQIDNLKHDLATEERRENTYGQLFEQNKKELREAKTQLKLAQAIQDNAEATLADIELLLEVVADFRAVSIKNTIQNIEDKTNQLLSNHFDAEIKVLFSAEAADKIDVTILKDGNTCSYGQLSKGQRQLLKLCFGVSVMKSVANHSGVAFNTIFIDEALEGLDEAMKVRTYGLLQSLQAEYESIFVVDHSESLKAMFTNKYSVSLVDGSSQIEKS